VFECSLHGYVPHQRKPLRLHFVGEREFEKS
jgi:hypothetical protein